MFGNHKILIRQQHVIFKYRSLTKINDDDNMLDNKLLHVLSKVGLTVWLIHMD